MKLTSHLMASTGTSILLYPFLGMDAGFFWVSSILVDADHYLDYLYRNGLKDFGVKRMFLFHRILSEGAAGAPNFLGLNVMHTLEFLLPVGALAALTGYPSVWAAFWGLVFHIALDLIWLSRRGILTKRALSIIEYAIRWNLMKRRGWDPERPYVSALESTLNE